MLPMDGTGGMKGRVSAFPPLGSGCAVSSFLLGPGRHSCGDQEGFSWLKEGREKTVSLSVPLGGSSLVAPRRISAFSVLSHNS